MFHLFFDCLDWKHLDNLGQCLANARPILGKEKMFALVGNPDRVDKNEKEQNVNLSTKFHFFKNAGSFKKCNPYHVCFADQKNISDSMTWKILQHPIIFCGEANLVEETEMIFFSLGKAIHVHSRVNKYR